MRPWRAHATACRADGSARPGCRRLSRRPIRPAARRARDRAHRHSTPAAAQTRIMQVRGPEYYVYAPDPGLFEPLVELGDEITAGTPAALIHPHDTPWRAPATAAFGHAGTVICKRVPGRVERGDCLFHVADDFAP